MRLKHTLLLSMKYNYETKTHIVIEYEVQLWDLNTHCYWVWSTIMRLKLTLLLSMKYNYETKTHIVIEYEVQLCVRLKHTLLLSMKYNYET